MSKYKIVHIASEIDPFSKTGGLADVTRSLSKAQKRLGHNVIVITPLYGKIINKKKHELKLIESDVKLIINSQESIKVNYYKGYLMKDLLIYFIENEKYFSRRKTLYGSTHENARFMLFDIAALKLISLLKFNADIIHCHDWHTGLIPYFLKKEFRYSKTLKKAKTVFTIHNLVYQMGGNWWEVPAKHKDYGKSKLPRLSDPKIEYINFAKRAIINADIINTVSEQYAEEILTKKFGQDLHRILQNRQDKLFGIINGIDYNEYNPATDKSLIINYDYRKVHRKKLNKTALQKKLKLEQGINIPMIAMTSRVAFQKGFELLIQIIEPLSKLDFQLIVLGDGDKKYINKLQKYNKKYPHKIVWIPYKGNENLETLIYAASDMLLLPSHHEPCGINQLIAMRYGCIPIVRKIGGLYDTVKNFDPEKKIGTGFTFNRFDKYSLLESIIRALETRKHKQVWRDIMVRDMLESNSWEIPAKKYLTLYRKAMSNGDGKSDKNHKKPKIKNKK